MKPEKYRAALLNRFLAEMEYDERLLQWTNDTKLLRLKLNNKWFKYCNKHNLAQKFDLIYEIETIQVQNILIYKYGCKCDLAEIRRRIIIARSYSNYDKFRIAHELYYEAEIESI